MNDAKNRKELHGKEETVGVFGNQEKLIAFLEKP